MLAKLLNLVLLLATRWLCPVSAFVWPMDMTCFHNLGTRHIVHYRIVNDTYDDKSGFFSPVMVPENQWSLPAGLEDSEEATTQATTMSTTFGLGGSNATVGDGTRLIMFRDNCSEVENGLRECAYGECYVLVVQGPHHPTERIILCECDILFTGERCLIPKTDFELVVSAPIKTKEVRSIARSAGSVIGIICGSFCVMAVCTFTPIYMSRKHAAFRSVHKETPQQEQQPPTPDLAVDDAGSITSRRNMPCDGAASSNFEMEILTAPAASPEESIC